MSKEKSFKVKVKSVGSDKSLRKEEGWVNMILGWVVDEKTVGSEFGCPGVYDISNRWSACSPHP